tara:strand:- start:206 stop:346 length:141 start_codon:yes stop_codon:yes gene_type:complete
VDLELLIQDQVVVVQELQVLQDMLIQVEVQVEVVAMVYQLQLLVHQ